MGRQAYLTRLALGRSPYGDLLRDEQGNVVVGLHSQDNTASGYAQAFDYKGRPTNGETERANRRLIRAQNEVLRVAGVVRKRDDGPAMEGLDEAATLKLLDSECDVGANLGYFTGLFCQISDWWLEAWRSRVFVFKSLLEPPVLATLAIERRTYGLLSFLFSGLPWALCAGTLNLLRNWTLYASPPFRRLLQTPRTRYENHEMTLPVLVHLHLVDLIFFSFEWPLRAFAILQSMQLIPLSAFPSWRSFIPWMAESPLQISNVIGRIMAGDAMGVLIALHNNPFVLAYISDLIRESLSSGFHAVLSNCLPQPNEPDSWSREAITRFCANEEPPFSRDRLIGVRLGIDPMYSQMSNNELLYNFRRQYKGPQTVLAALRSAFPGFFGLLGRFIEFDRLGGTELDEGLLTRLRTVCRRRYVHLKRLHHHMLEVDDQQIREEASLQGFDRVGLDLIELGIDIEKWTSDLILPDYDTLTPTPETLSVIEGMGEVAEPVRSTNSYAVEESLDSAEEQGATAQPSANNLDRVEETVEEPAEETVQEPAEETVEEPAEETVEESAEESAEETVEETVEEITASNSAPDPRLLPEVVPELGAVTAADVIHESTAAIPVQTLLESIERDATADIPQEASSPTARLPPGVRVRRRPTELDEEISDIAVELRSSLLNLTEINPVSLQTYGVTHLSLMSTDVFSMFTSSIIASTLMLPLDIYLARLLVRGFALAVPAGRGSGILRDVWPVSPWAAAREMGIGGNLRFFSRVFWSLGVQSIMAATISAGLAAVARWIGRRWFGWGRFSSTTSDTVESWSLTS